jgi:hypothetical protein
MAWWDRILGRKDDKPPSGEFAKVTSPPEPAREKAPPAPRPRKGETRARKKKTEVRPPASPPKPAPEKLAPQKSAPQKSTPDQDLCARGALRQSRGDTEGALADYQKAIEINPLSAKAYAGRGLAREIKGDLAGAKADYSKSVEIEVREALNANFPEAGLGNSPPETPPESHETRSRNRPAD